MKKITKIILILAIILILLVTACFTTAYFVLFGNYNSDKINEDLSINLPYSELFKVTSTAKGENMQKLARMGMEIYTFYLDNSECVNGDSTYENDKDLKLIRINSEGEYEIFDSIPVWMHGNVLVNTELQRIYYTTYEGTGGMYGRVKIYTYQKNTDGSLSRIEEKTLADDALNDQTLSANPRVGADIDENGNIAVSFGQFPGYMVTHVFNAATEEWTMHRVMHYTEGLDYGDTNYYPYVRINGVNDIRIAAKQDTSYLNGVYNQDKLWFQYIRYFRYDGSEWSNKIIHDIRDADNPENNDDTVITCELYADGEDTHIIVKDNKNIIHYIISSEGKVSKRNIGILNNKTINFLKITEVNGKKFYVASGIGLDITGFQLTGFIAVYDYDNLKLQYRNNDICKTPFLSVAKQNDYGYIDIMTISRDKEYKENNETDYIRLKLN